MRRLTTFRQYLLEEYKYFRIYEKNRLYKLIVLIFPVTIFRFKCCFKSRHFIFVHYASKNFADLSINTKNIINILLTKMLNFGRLKLHKYPQKIALVGFTSLYRYDYL